MIRSDPDGLISSVKGRGGWRGEGFYISRNPYFIWSQLCLILDIYNIFTKFSLFFIYLIKPRRGGNTYQHGNSAL